MTEPDDSDIEEGSEFAGPIVIPRDRAEREALSIRMDRDLYERLRDASRAFGLPMNFMAVKAVEEFLDNLVDPAEFRLTRREASRD